MRKTKSEIHNAPWKRYWKGHQRGNVSNKHYSTKTPPRFRLVICQEVGGATTDENWRERRGVRERGCKTRKSISAKWSKFLLTPFRIIRSVKS